MLYIFGADAVTTLVFEWTNVTVATPWNYCLGWVGPPFLSLGVYWQFISYIALIITESLSPNIIIGNNNSVYNEVSLYDYA